MNGIAQIAPLEDRFELKTDGVWHTARAQDGSLKIPQRVCGWLDVIAETSDTKGHNCGFHLNWHDRNGRTQDWIMPAAMLAGDGSELAAVLLSRGLFVESDRTARKLLMRYVGSREVECRQITVDKTGWLEAAFVTPTRIYGQYAGGEVVFQDEEYSQSAYGTGGTLPDWQHHVAALCAGSSRLVFALSAGFAGPLLRKLGCESGGFHIIGNSGIGKSTAQHVASSVWGSHGYKQSWHATINGLEGVAARHNDGLLVLDEMGLKDAKDIGEVAYMLANGQGKMRATKSGGMRQVKTWALLFISSGELSLEQHMATTEKHFRAGQEVRLPDIPAQAHPEWGIFECLHGFPSSKALAEALYENTRCFYGSAGDAFLQRLTQEPESRFVELKQRWTALVKTLLPSGAGTQAGRVLSRFALVAIAGELATEYGITGWQPGEATIAAKACCAAWLTERGDAGNQEVRAIKSQVRGFFEKHGDSRFQHAKGTDRNPIPNRAGFVLPDDNGDEFWVLGSVFKQEICKGFSLRQVTQVLMDAGWLAPDNQGKSTQNKSPKGMPQTRVYVFTPKLWETAE